jgi:hypothetical protein
MDTQTSIRKHSSLTQVVVPETVVKLRWINCSQDVAVHSLLLGKKDSEEVRTKVLARLGIVRHAEESFLQAWTRAMCEENGFPVEYPVCAELREAIEWNPEVMRFVFFLA